jgi:hypothetical protein
MIRGQCEGMSNDAIAWLRWRVPDLTRLVLTPAVKSRGHVK